MLTIVKSYHNKQAIDASTLNYAAKKMLDSNLTIKCGTKLYSCTH